MVTYNFFEDYSNFLRAARGLSLYQGYEHEANETDFIIEELGKDADLFEALFEPAYNNVMYCGRGESGSDLVHTVLAGKSVKDLDKFLAGCSVVSAVLAAAQCRGHASRSDDLISRYAMINQVSRHLSGLSALISAVSGCEFRIHECGRVFAFGLVTRLQYSGVFIGETRRIKRKTECFLRVNAKLPLTASRELGVYRTPGRIRLLAGRPVYLDSHFTHVSPIIIDSTSNMHRSRCDSTLVLEKLSGTRVFFDEGMAYKNIESLKLIYPELRSVTSSEDAIALLKSQLAERAAKVVGGADTLGGGGPNEDA